MTVCIEFLVEIQFLISKRLITKMMTQSQDGYSSVWEYSPDQKGFNQFANDDYEIRDMMEHLDHSHSLTHHQIAQHQGLQNLLEKKPNINVLEKQFISELIPNCPVETIHTSSEDCPKPNISSPKNYEKHLCSLIRQILKKMLKKKKLQKKETYSVFYIKMFWDEIKADVRPSLRTLKKFLIDPNLVEHHKTLTQKYLKYEIKFVNFRSKNFQQMELLRYQAREMIVSEETNMILKAGLKDIKDPDQFVKYVKRFLDNLREGEIKHGKVG